jgi:hypothetical protein
VNAPRPKGPTPDGHALNKILILLLDKQYHSRISLWDTNYWTPYIEICRPQNYKVEITNNADSKVDKIVVYSENTTAIVGRYCVHSADVTELGTLLGSPGSYEPVFDNWVRFVRKFYRVDVAKLKPDYVCQKRNTLV